jgi:hypothetical protein
MMTGGLLLLGCAFGLTMLAKADAIEADFVRAELPPDSTTITTPIFLGPPGDISSDNLNNTSVGEIVFLKFKIPDIADVVSIDSFDFFVTVYDDDDGGGESGDIDFAQPGANLQFLDTFTNLNHTTADDPLTIEIQLTQAEIDQVFPSLSDGTFRIQISRDTGDFYVAPTGSAEIDGVLSSDMLSTPEPSTMSVMMTGLCVIGCLLIGRRRSSGRV